MSEKVIPKKDIMKTKEALQRIWIWICTQLQFLARRGDELLSHYFSSEDLVVEGSKSYSNFLIKRCISLLYKIIILATVVFYLTADSKPSLFERLAFLGILSYVTMKLLCVLPKESGKLLRKHLLIELGAFYISNMFFFSLNSQVTFFIRTGACMIFTSILQNIFYSVGSVLVEILFFICKSEENFSSSEFLKKLAFMFCINFLFFFQSKVYEFILAEYKKRYQQSEQEAKKQITSKSMFLASISHDLKNPLTSITGTIDSLKDSPNFSRQEKKDLITASYSCQILLYLIGNITDVSKVDAGKFDLEYIPMNIELEVKKILRIENEMAKKKGIGLYRVIQNPFPKRVLGDPMRFAQVLINFLGNAIKFTSRGYVGIALRWARNATEAREYRYPKEAAGTTCWIPEERFFLDNICRNSLWTECRQIKKKNEEKETFEGLEESVGERLGKYFKNTSLKNKLKFERYSGCYSAHDDLIKKNRYTFEDNLPYNKKHRTRVQLKRYSDKVPSEMVIRKSEILFDKKNQEMEIGEENGILVVDIFDTGVGMNPSELSRLFKPFSQANSGVKQRYGGTGLGLWITKQLVQLMHGMIEVNSEPGKGSRFRIFFPFQSIKEASSLASGELHMNEEEKSIVPADCLELRAAKKKQFCGSDKTLKQMRVLFLEDTNHPDESKCLQIIKQLRKTDVFLHYSTYSEALSTLQAESFDFLSILIISANPPALTQKLACSINKTFVDEEIKHIPVAIFADLELVNELEFCSDFQMTFPLLENSVIPQLHRMKTRALRKNAMGGCKSNLIEDMMRKANLTAQDLYNPFFIHHVLLADDDVFSNAAVKKMIESKGNFAVAAFYNGAEALNCYKESPDYFQLVLLDLTMPLMDGMEAARQIRAFQTHFGKRHVPIVGITGYESCSVKADCQAAGMSEVITKPISKILLMDLLHRHCNS